MKVLKIIIKNAFRHKLRTILTIFGIAIAVIAFNMLQTVVTAWHYGLEASSSNRLITRQAVSFIFPLPYAYKDKIANIEGVEKVTFSNWFQGVYIDKNQFFTRIAIEAETFFDVYPEFLIPQDEKETFLKERNSCVIGIEIAKQYNLKVGDIMTVEGDIYPGRWDFIVRGIYKPKFESTDAMQMFFHWQYVNERMIQESPERANEVGWYSVRIKNPDNAATISTKIDKLFANSNAETKTETERAFVQNFISASSAIITSMNVMSFIIVGIIMLVLGNTMIMSARERTREYAVLKTLGFSGKHLVGLILGESFVISAFGAGVGLFLTIPIIEGFSQAIPKSYFPVFKLEDITLILSISSAFIVGLLAAIFPIQRALTTKIVDGFRHIG